MVDEHGVVTHVHQRPLASTVPIPAKSNWTRRKSPRSPSNCPEATLADAGGCDAVGITNQRATTVVFDPGSSLPVGPALSWQDLRTVFDCLSLQGQGIRLAPNQSATKIRWLVDSVSLAAHDLRFATLETWLAWHFSEGESSSRIVRTPASADWLTRTEGVGQPRTSARSASTRPCSPSSSTRWARSARPMPSKGHHRRCPLVGDQPASLFGQSCVEIRREDHLWHWGNARHGPRHHRAAVLAALQVRLLSDRAAKSKRRGHLGCRGHRLQRWIVCAVALRPRD